MSENERRWHLKQRKRRVRIYRCMIGVVLLALVILITSLCFGFITNADTPTERHAYKYYTDVVVQEGENLWEIAGRYMTEEYDSPREYIREVKKINSLKNIDQIYEGQRIVVPYYSTELKY